MKKSLTALVLALSLTNCNSYAIIKDSINQSEQRLYVNTANKHYKINKNRSKGEKELVDLILTNCLEEAWVYVENSSGNGSWYEHGLYENQDRMKLDLNILEDIVREQPDIKKIAFYHIHPIDKDKARDVSQTFSSKDLKTYTIIIYWLKSTYPQLAGKVEFNVAVSTGVYTIRFEKTDFNQSDLEKLDKIIDSVSNERVRIKVGFSKNFDYSAKNKDNFTKQNKRFARMFNNNLVKIEFKPLEVEDVSE